MDVATQHGWPTPSYQCVYKVIKRLDPGLVTLAHAGSKAYRTTFDLLYRREAQGPNDIWQADHTLWISGHSRTVSPLHVPGSPSLWMITAEPLPGLR